MKKPVTITIIVLVLAVICCCLVVLISGTAWAIFQKMGITTSSGTGTGNNAQQQITEQPEITMIPETVDTGQINSAADMLQVLRETNIPISNYYDLARRLTGKKNVPLTVPAPLIKPEIGDTQTFWVTNTDTHETFQIDANLKYETDHIYFWVQDGVDAAATDIKNLSETFENKIYPTNREFFGSEWTPGVDNDPHLYIVLGTGLGESLAGYFSSSDEYNPEVHEFSNAHEMFLLNADGIVLDDQFTYGVLAHEFQHMIHWYGDLNEETWMNEGFSELAALLNGYDVGGFDQAYIMNTDMQLTDWASDLGDNSPHYGASFLFVSYFLDRFGEQATKELISSPDNGLTSIDKLLEKLNMKDEQTQKVITSEDLFSDWVVTNYLNDASLDNGRYSYSRYKGFVTTGYSSLVENCPTQPTTTQVYQYGADYVRIDCSGQHTIHFKGQPVVKILDQEAHSGQYAFWSNKGDESNTALTREFDFTQQKGPLTFQFYTWYDLEQDYDYAYLEVSEDGEQWDIINTPSGTDKDISGNSFGWGYNGNSEGWIEESVDLSVYAGKKVQIRFEYITDAAVNGEGMLIDDIQIPEINYQEDFESGTGDWIPAGFVRSENILPQTFRLNLIRFSQDGTTITSIPLDENQVADIPFENKSGENVVLTISGTTGFTRQPAIYEYSIE
jgi:immune inhibitor A